MMPNTPTRQVTFGDDARFKILKGAEVVYQAVKSTYSPLSGNVAIENQFNERSTVSHDGVTVARAITLSDPVENIGARMIVDASMKTNDIAGDGTSATVILAYHILKEANRMVLAGYNPMLLRKGIDIASVKIKNELKEMSFEVASPSQLRDVATISCGDRELGSLIADTIDEVGVNGGVTVEEYQGLGVESEIVEGFYFDKGYDSPYFMTEANESALLKNAKVLIVEDKITNISQIETVLEDIADSDNKRIIIIGNVAGNALHQLVVNRIKGSLEVVTVSPAIYGDQKQQHLEDLAVLTGAKVVMAGTPAKSISDEYLGFTKEVVVTKDSTTIIADKPTALEERIDKLKASIEQEKNQFRKDNMKKRLAMLEGKIAIIRVGGESESIAHEKKLRVDDAVHATQAARDHGIVPGGATALLHISNLLSSLPQEIGDSGVDVTEGEALVYRALKQPFLQLMANAGLPGEYNLRAIELAGSRIAGFNVLAPTDEPVDLLEAGVIDPTLVISQVVENGCASAGLALTNNATITFEKNGNTDNHSNAN